MELDALRDAWLRRPIKVATTWTVDQEIVAVLDRGRRLERRVRIRDWLETGASLLLLPFAVMMLATGENWWLRLGGGTMVLVSIMIPIRLRLARRMMPEPDLPLVIRLHQEIAYLRAQEHLLRTTAWWYFSPILLSVVLMTVGGPGSAAGKGGLIGVVTVLYVVMVAANRRASRTTFAARRHELEEWLENLAWLERDALAAGLERGGER